MRTLEDLVGAPAGALACPGPLIEDVRDRRGADCAAGEGVLQGRVELGRPVAVEELQVSERPARRDAHSVTSPFSQPWLNAL